MAACHTREVHSQRGLDRIVGFSDGVVAIAITLLVLPLVTDVTARTTDVQTFLQTDAFSVFVFVLSFAVIGRFWVIHHQLYEQVIDYDRRLLWANLLWLLCIVFQPFTTELLASHDEDRLVYGIYIGGIAATAAAGLLQQWVIVRSPELQDPAVRGSLRLLPSITVTVLLVAALVVAVALPAIGLWSLALVAASGPAERVLARAVGPI